MPGGWRGRARSAPFGTNRRRAAGPGRPPAPGSTAAASAAVMDLAGAGIVKVPVNMAMSMNNVLPARWNCGCRFGMTQGIGRSSAAMGTDTTPDRSPAMSNAGCRYQIYIESGLVRRPGSKIERLWNWCRLSETGEVTARGTGYESLALCYHAVNQHKAVHGELPVKIDLLYSRPSHPSRNGALPFRNTH